MHRRVIRRPYTQPHQKVLLTDELKCNPQLPTVCLKKKRAAFDEKNTLLIVKHGGGYIMPGVCKLHTERPLVDPGIKPRPFLCLHNDSKFICWARFKSFLRLVLSCGVYGCYVLKSERHRIQEMNRVHTLVLLAWWQGLPFVLHCDEES